MFSRLTSVAVALLTLSAPALAADKPNFLMLWGDDIGYWNVSAYNQGMMGYETPNIDRIADEGMLFTHAYGEQSCTAGRAAFVTGQSGFRTGLLKVGLPGAKEGMDERDPTIAEYLKSKGYMTGQFGKTTSVTVMSTCRPTMVSMSSSATCTTSMPRKSPSIRTIQKIPLSGRNSVPGASSNPQLTAALRTPGR